MSNWISKVSICTLKSVMTTNYSQVKTLVRMISMQIGFPETVSYSLYSNSSDGGLSQTIPQVKKPDVEVLGWSSYMWSAVVKYCIIL